MADLTRIVNFTNVASLSPIANGFDLIRRTIQFASLIHETALDSTKCEIVLNQRTYTAAYFSIDNAVFFVSDNIWPISKRDDTYSSKYYTESDFEDVCWMRMEGTSGWKEPSLLCGFMVDGVFHGISYEKTDNNNSTDRNSTDRNNTDSNNLTIQAEVMQNHNCIILNNPEINIPDYRIVNAVAKLPPAIITKYFDLSFMGMLQRQKNGGHDVDIHFTTGSFKLNSRLVHMYCNPELHNSQIIITELDASRRVIDYIKNLFGIHVGAPIPLELDEILQFIKISKFLGLKFDRDDIELESDSSRSD